MTWYKALEQKRRFLIGGIIIICIAILMLTARRNVTSFDGYWHLKAGMDWLEYGFSPWLDRFSFTFNGKEITSPPYIFQASLAWMVNTFGLEPGFQIFRFACFISLFSLFIILMRKLRTPTLIYIIVLPIVVVLLQFRSLVRPELISYSFSVIAVLLYYRTRNNISTAGMLPIIGLIWIWSNYHSPIIGYIIFFGYFVDIALKQLHEGASVRTWLTWLGWGLVIFLVGFLTPGFQHPLMILLTFSPKWIPLIQEYLPALQIYHSTPAFYALIAITLATMLLLLWKRQFGLLIVCIVLTYNAALMVRLVAPGGIVILCIFVWVVSELDLSNRINKLSALPRNLIAAISIIIFSLTLWSGIHLARTLMDENKFTEVRFPGDIVEYMNKHEIKGRIFNDFPMGGFLIYKLSPDSTVYIDGRTVILYPIKHYLLFKSAMKSPSVLRSEIENYEINLAILKRSHTNLSLVRDTGKMSLDYAGVQFALFRSEQPNFPTFGTLLADSACWNSAMLPLLEAEQTIAQQILPENSFLRPAYIQFLIDYSKAENRVSFLTKQNPGDRWSDFKLRFAAYQALSLKLDPFAINAFTQIRIKEFTDYLGAALAQSRLGEWSLAEQYLDQATRSSSSNKAFEITILHALLTQIRQHKGLELFDDVYLKKIAGDSRSTDNSVVRPLPEISDFCPQIE